MKQRNSSTKNFALIIGLFLLVEGIWGMFSEVIFGFLTTNTRHAVIHLILGIAALYFYQKKSTRGYCMFLGLLLLIVGILRFVPGINNVVLDLFNINYAVALLNIIVGIIALLIGNTSRERRISTQKRAYH